MENTHTPTTKATVWMPEGTDPASTEANAILGAERGRAWLNEEPRSVGDAMAELNEVGTRKVQAASRGEWDIVSFWGGYQGQISAAITEALGR
ncbi:hypothetical protein F4Y93_12710 [Candidatus Poribacteria bacterium]|nr:hypothetical protein [Candidatus Poribacteria bacterium]